MEGNKYGVVSEEVMSNAFRVCGTMLLSAMLGVGAIAYGFTHKKNQPASPSSAIVTHKNRPIAPKQ